MKGVYNHIITLLTILLPLSAFSQGDAAASGDSDDPDAAVAVAFEAETGVVIGEDATRLVGKAANIVESVQSLSDTKKKVESQRKLYNYYKSCVDYVELVSTNLRTRDEIKDLAENMSRITSMYQAYGIDIKNMSTLYDFDKYINPVTYDRFIREMNMIFLDATRCVERIASVIGGKFVTGSLEFTAQNTDFVRNGGTVEHIKFETDDSKTVKSSWKMHETERYTLLIQANLDLRRCIHDMYRLIEDLCRTYGVQQQKQSYEQMMKSMFNYENYHYTVIW